jgi:hypothetical protein
MNTTSAINNTMPIGGVTTRGSFTTFVKKGIKKTFIENGISKCGYFKKDESGKEVFTGEYC